MSKINGRLGTIIIIAFLIIGIFTVEYLHTQRENDLQKQITSLQLENQEIRKITSSQGDTILIQKAIITSSQSSIHRLTDSIFSLSRKHQKQISSILSYFKSVTVTNIDSFPIPYKDTIAMKKFEDSIVRQCIQVIQYMMDSMITVPRKVEKIDQNFRFLGTIQKDSFLIDSLSIPDTLQLRFVEKGGFLKKRIAEVQFFHSNPLITTSQANSVIYKPPKKKRVLEKALLIGAGLFIGTKL